MVSITILYVNTRITTHNPRTHALTTNKSRYNQSITHYFIMSPKVEQRAGQLSLTHVGITKTERKETKTDKQVM